MPTNQFKKFINKTNIILKRGKPLLALKLAKINMNAILFNRVPPFRQVEIQVTFECKVRSEEGALCYQGQDLDEDSYV